MMHLIRLLFIETVRAADFIQLPTGPITKKQTGPGIGVLTIFNRLADLIVHIAYPLAFVAVIYTAYVMITSSGNSDAYGKARKNLFYVITGIFFIVFANILLNLVIKVLQ